MFESNREHAVQCRTQRLLTVVMGVAPAAAADKEVDVGVGQRGDRPAVLRVVRPEVLVGLVVRTALRGEERLKAWRGACVCATAGAGAEVPGWRLVFCFLAHGRRRTVLVNQSEMVKLASAE